MGRNRGRHGLTIDNSPNSNLANSADTGPLLKICFWDEGGRRMCGSAVAGGAWFCMSYMDDCNTDSIACIRVFKDDLTGRKGGRG